MRKMVWGARKNSLMPAISAQFVWLSNRFGLSKLGISAVAGI